MLLYVTMSFKLSKVPPVSLNYQQCKPKDYGLKLPAVSVA